VDRRDENILLGASATSAALTRNLRNIGWHQAADMVANNPAYGGYTSQQQLNALKMVGLA
jgi:hypothetical protein